MLPQRHGTIVWHGKGDEALLKLRRQIAIEEAASARVHGAQDMFSDCANFQPGLSKQVMK